MYCLHCGDCCKRMSPISAPEPCPHLIEDGDFVFCGIYEDRPEECKNHTFHARVCPVGASVLNIQDTEKLRQRIDVGFEKTCSLGVRQ